MRVGEIASGRAGDKGDILDLTLVAYDAAGYERLERALNDAVRNENYEKAAQVRDDVAGELDAAGADERNLDHGSIVFHFILL